MAFKCWLLSDTVPDDVLYHIFNLSIAADKDWREGRRDWTDTPPFAMQLSQLSSRVRRIVLSAPTLWTTIDGSVLRSSSILDRYLDRSKQCVLDIRAHSEWWKSATMFLRLLPVLIVHIHRWRQLDVIASVGDLMHVFKSLGTLSAPQLKDLRFRTEVHTNMYHPPHIFSIFVGGTPMLSHLQITGISCIPGGLDALTHLKLYRHACQRPLFSYPVFLQMFTAMHHLADLEIYGEAIAFPREMGALKPLHLPTLRSLKVLGLDIIYPSSQVPYHILAACCITFSKSPLRHVNIKIVAGPSAHSYNIFLEHLDSGMIQFPYVQSLSWDAHIRDENDALILIRSSPAMHTLTLAQGSETFIDVLMRHDENPSNATGVLWPYLRTVTLHKIGRTDIHALLSARIAMGSPVLQLRLPQVKKLPFSFTSVADLPYELCQSSNGAGWLDLHYKQRVAHLVITAALNREMAAS